MEQDTGVIRGRVGGTVYADILCQVHAYIFARTDGARAHSSIFPKLSLVIEDVETILKGGNHF